MGAVLPVVGETYNLAPYLPSRVGVLGDGGGTGFWKVYGALIASAPMSVDWRLSFRVQIGDASSYAWMGIGHNIYAGFSTVNHAGFDPDKFYFIHDKSQPKS